MKSSESSENHKPAESNVALKYLNFGGFVLTLVVMFVVANSELSLVSKLAVLVLLIVTTGFFNLIVLNQLLGRRLEPVFEEPIEIEGAKTVFDDDIESKLFALEEASQFFGASLKASDMFRLVSSRINEMIPFETCAFFQGEAGSEKLKLAFSDGKNASSLANLEIRSSVGLAGKSFTTRACQLERQNLLDRGLFGKEFLPATGPSIAAPLFRDFEIFGVLQLFGGQANEYGESSLKLLEAIAERFSPLILSSIAFENNLSNALTDFLTNLPNERAYFLVLENQIAESQRSREDRPLSVLAMDIKNFNEINRQFGHSTGDGILSYAAEIIKNQLRGMDFLARSSSDEFLAVLPTASEETTLEIIARLEQVFEVSPFDVADGNKIQIQLNHGSATFWKDGETPSELLKAARIRKGQNKTSGTVKIIQFPSGK